MLLSIAGGTSIATPVNTSVGQGENKVLQAQLGNNLTNASLVAGNSNIVNDTLGTGSWKFYVAGNTSVASISSASASTEWTVGNLLSYSLPLKIYYPLKVPDINPLNALQVGEYSTGTYVYNGTLNNGATIAVETAPAGSRVAGQGYLKVVYASNQYFQFPSFTTGTSGISFAFWFRSNASSANYARIFDCGNGTQTYNISMTIHLNFLSVLVYANGGAPQYINDNITGYSVNDNVWRHVAWILSPNGNYSFYINGALVTTVAAWYPTSILRTGCYLSWTAFGGGGSGINGGIDDFRYYESVLSASDVTNIYGGGNGPIGTIKDATSGVTWIPKTGTVVDSSETSYTVKSTEIALIPGTKSTYAVWTAPKSTNIRVDVSFADYHTRSAGVGFQMFKINADNTFGSSLFPRTVTTLALTDAAPTNYLTVPSTSLSVSTGDKIYLRVDANGNSASASSVLATNIYADPNIDLKQNLYLQAKLGNDVAATTFVSGNVNVVNDTLGTGSWKFYVAGNTSVASISSASASTEWTSGSLLSYTLPLSVYYTFNTNKVSGNTITDSVGNYTGTLVNGATISTSNPSPATGSGYLSMNVSLSQYASLSPITNSRVGMSFSFWMRPTTASTPHILSFGNGVLVDNVIFSMISNNYVGIIVKGAAVSASGYLSPTNNVSGNDGVWKHIVWTLDPTNVWKFYLNGSLSNSYSGASYYYPNPVTTTTNYIGRSIFGDPYYGGDVDDFRYYGVVLSASDVTNVYGGGTGPTVGKNMDATTGVTWMSTPAIVVNSSETSYTVKSTEIALLPGTNSTFAVWTATKSTNIKVDVSFADYHTRSAGVGFQMFKIKSDNTFDSVLFSRTVTTLALTDAAPTNYLSVPSINTSMNAGDKLYYRIDANGNTTAASSVLATSIYTDYVSIATNTAENKVLQAQLGNNLTNASLVAGNSNTVLDTIGTGSWKFYVAGNTSVASISSASASTEWTSGSILPYVLPPTVPPSDMALWYTMDLNKVTGTTIYDSIGNYSATLVNGATISTANYKYGGASLYLNNNTQNYASGNAKYLSLPTITVSITGFTLSFWLYINSSSAGVTMFDFATAPNQSSNNMLMLINQSEYLLYPNISTGSYVQTSGGNFAFNQWQHVCITIDPTKLIKIYINSTSRYSGVFSGDIFTTGVKTSAIFGATYYPNIPINGYVDDFRTYPREITQTEVSAIYAGTIPPKLTDVTSGATWMPTSATPVDATETNYTVKSTEIALNPGTNSTYAVWTAPKSTNIRVDVSFADYHTRSAGVGFQMFKINADNTFGSTLFPRTVTTLALTDAAPTNYLTVPSTSLSVSTGDKIYLRVDANGNSVAASSVLATNIYADPNIDLKQNLYLQAKLGNDVAATTFVSGNANIVNDTLGTGSWKFYVAGNTSVASISSASASTEWTGGSLLSGQYDFDGTLVGGATLVVDAGSRYTGNPYLKLINPTFNTSPFQYAKFIPVSIPSGGVSFSMWVKHTHVAGTYPFFMSIRGGLTRIDMGLGNPSLNWYGQAGGSPIFVGFFSTITNGNWHHLVWTISASGMYNFYLDNLLKSTQQSTHPGAGLRTYYNIGSYNDSADPFYLVNGGIDNFKLFTRELTALEVTAEYNNNTANSPFTLKSDSGSAPKWTIKPATPVDSSETSYTVKSTEIALLPGTNSTFAVWTATKSTNIKVDVSFADYHTRSAGVGFQMFKIKSDNTFDYVLFSRTVTTTAITDATLLNATANYLSVPSVTTSMNAGDKLYYRIDANGNTTAASSVLATSIYTDAVSIATNTNENKLLQAQLGNNLTNASLVAGNSNTVLDTIGTGNWKFYVAGNTSVASISSASASSEWTSGSILPYVLPPTVPTDMALWYTMDLNKVTSTTIYDSVGNFTATLVNGATISTANYKYGDASLYLNNTQNYASGNAKYLSLPTITVSITGFTLSFWLYVNSSSVGNFLFDFATAPNQSGNNMLMHISGSEYVLYPNWSTRTFVITSGGNFAFNQWQHVCITIDPTKLIKIYVNSISRYSGVFSGDIFTNGVKTSAIFGATYLSDIPINGYVDDFRTYPRAITADEVSLIYSQASLYYPLNVPDINSGNTLQVGEYSTGSYVYNGTLVGGATIVANSGSRVSGQGYLSLVAASSQHLTLPSVTIGSTGMSASCWFRSNASSDQATIFKFGNTTPDFFAPIIVSNRIFVFVMKGGNGGYVDVGCPTLVNDNVWRHVVITEHPTNGFFMFLNGVSYSGGSFNLNGTTFTLNYLGRGDVYLNGGIDDFRFYNRVITQSEITTLYAGPPPPALKDVTSGAAWVYKPAVPVDATETSYTVKSTEIALIPGTNSTFAVWTAPKSTNIRVDVSFADYHTRSAGVGFQMFKINNDNTFGSTLFPRTVTTLALTDAAPTNYLTVPSTNLSVSTGDKIYLRVDANGNSVAASSVLATNIYSYSGPWS